MRDLTVLEQIILAAIISLEDDAYGVSIRRKVKKETGKSLMYGTLYKALDQLSRKAYVLKAGGTSTADRDGSRKIYYTVSPKGKSALSAAIRLHKAIWKIIPNLADDSKP